MGGHNSEAATQADYMFMDEKGLSEARARREGGKKLLELFLSRFLSNKQVMKCRRN